MPQTEGGVPAERTVAVGDDDGDRAAREAERLGDGAVQAPVGAGEEPAEGAADPLREPHCQTVEKDRGLREEGAVPVRQDKEVRGVPGRQEHPA